MNRRIRYPLRWHLKAFYHCRVAPILCLFLGHARKTEWYRAERDYEQGWECDCFCRRCHESLPPDFWG